jgi:hypothetical protein
MMENKKHARIDGIEFLDNRVGGGNDDFEKKRLVKKRETRNDYGTPKQEHAQSMFDLINELDGQISTKANDNQGRSVS